jgi:uncharacterized membrane protein
VGILPSKVTTLAIQIGSLIAISLVSAIAPSYMPIFFIIYIVVIMLIMTRMTMAGFKKPSDVKGAPLFKEDNARVAMSSDVELLQEVKEQFKMLMLLMFTPFLIIFIIPPLYSHYIAPYIEGFARQLSSSEIVVRFISTLVFYALIMLSVQVPRLAMMSRARQRKQMLAPQVFALYKDGLLMDNRFLKLEKDMCYKVNSKRRFIQILSPRLPYDIRLYTLETSKLVDKLREVGLYECRA